MGTIYVQTTGSATNSGSTDADASSLTVTVDGSYAGGATIQLASNPDLSGVVTAAGATQSAIYFGDATNANRKIFWITAKDDAGTPNTITVDTAPTGLAAGTSTGNIGGRIVWTPANVEAALRAGDTVIINDSIAASSATVITSRTNGDSTTGIITIRGKTGVRPIVTCSGSGNNCINIANSGWKIENLELQQTHASSGTALSGSGSSTFIYNVKISDAGTNGISTNNGWRVYQAEITGTVADGINSVNGLVVFGCYIHDCGQDGIEDTSVGPATVIAFSVIDTCAARGVYFSAATTAIGTGTFLMNNTVYGCGNSGLEITDADTRVFLVNNIFQNNGNAAGEFNVEWVAGSDATISWHEYNCFNHDGGGGGANLSGVTTTSTEITSDPLFTNAASGDLSLQSTSPCKGTGYPGPFIGGPDSYIDMGAVQRQEPAGGGGGGGASINRRGIGIR